MGCNVEYLTVAEVRDALGEEVEDLSDAAIARKIDGLIGELEDNLGHTFGRAGVVVSTAADTVQVTTTALVVGGDTYLFATYPTLGELEAAVNGSGDSYGFEIASKVSPITPSTLLNTLGPVACGPTYDQRVYLCLAGLYVQLGGNRIPNLMLPLPLTSITSVVEDLVTLAATDYWAVPGDPWITRRNCSCEILICGHPAGRWSGLTPGNVLVTYVPRNWLRIPSALKGLLLEAFSSYAGAGPVESENWVGYSYRKSIAAVQHYRDILSSGTVAQYAVRFHP